MKISQMLATSMTLSLTATEEATRFGVSEVDLEHLLLALTLDEGPAGRALRDSGVTSEAAREAVAAQHREQLASLGVDADLPGDGRIQWPIRRGYDFTPRARDVLSNAGAKKKAGDPPAVLRELLAEPSGTVSALLQRLGTDKREIRTRLDTVQQEAPVRRTPTSPLMRTTTVFVPAPPEEIMALVRDPARLPEWEPGLERVDADGDAWRGTAKTSDDDGKPLRVAARHVRTRIVRDAHGDAHVAWRLAYPDDPRANTRRIAVSVREADGGSDVTVEAGWIRGAGPRGLRRAVAPITRLMMRPIVRWALWIQLTTLTAGISRALRG